MKIQMQIWDINERKQRKQIERETNVLVEDLLKLSKYEAFKSLINQLDKLAEEIRNQLADPRVTSNVEMLIFLQSQHELLKNILTVITVPDEQQESE